MKRKYPTGVSAVYKKQKTAGEAALVAVKSLKRRIAAATETKNLHKAAVNQAMDNTSTNIFSLSEVAQGVAITERVGLKLSAKHMRLRYNIRTATTGSQNARLIVVQYKKQVSDTPPTLAMVLEDTARPATSDYAFTTTKFKDSFRLLHDRVFSFNQAAGPAVQHVEVTLPLNNTITYNGVAATDLEKNGIYMLLISDIAAASSPPTLNYASCLYFSDD